MSREQYEQFAASLERVQGYACFWPYISTRTWNVAAVFTRVPMPLGARARDLDPVEYDPHGLAIFCPWRLETATAVLAGSGNTHFVEPVDETLPFDELPQELDSSVQPALRRLHGLRLLSTRVFRPSYMVWLDFEQQLRLWVFPAGAEAYDRASDWRPLLWLCAPLPPRQAEP